MLDIDATIVLCHSEKEQAAKTWKKTWGYHPLLCFLDATGEALSGLLRAGNAGSNTAADHITVLDQALAQIPDAHRHGSDVLIRCDSAGASHALLRHIRGLRGHGVRTFFSVGVAITEPIRTAITACVDWISALDADREMRDGLLPPLEGTVDSGPGLRRHGRSAGGCSTLGVRPRWAGGRGGLFFGFGSWTRSR